MKDMYYVRHGETEDLVANIRSRSSTNLTEQGREQARQAGALLVARRIMPELIISSAMPRAIQTAEEIAGVLGYDNETFIRNSLLNERDCGEAVGQHNSVIAERWLGGIDEVPGAESIEALQERAAQSLGWVMSMDTVSSALIVGHGTFGRAMVREVQGLPYTDEYAAGRAVIDNGQIVRLHPAPVEVL